MTFISLQFLIFFCLLLILLYFVKAEKMRQNILLVASYVFYAYADIEFLAFLLAQTAIAYGAAYFIDKRRKTGDRGKDKTIFVIGLIMCLLPLGFLKYCNFFADTFQQLLGITNTVTLNLLLPLGLSFYTFQSLSYIIDVYQERVAAERSLKNVALYVGFFPQITSGPIVKAHDFLPQLEDDHPIRRDNIYKGMQISLLGVIKKMVIADRLGVAVDAVYSAPGAYSGVSLIAATIAYTFQIYGDFSGYSDMAIGVATMLGYDLGRNFNAPYIARNPSDFWRRWHISLSSWFKEYLYFPLGGSRKGKYRSFFNLFVVMLVSGLWHGASWTFVAWGAYHGIGAVVHKMFATFIKKYHLESKTSAGKRASLIASIIETFIFVSIGWILFRADSFATASTVLMRISTMADGVSYVSIYTILYAVLVMAAHVIVLVRHKGEAVYINKDFTKLSTWFVFWLLVLLVLMFFYSGDTVFIYQQF